MLKFNLTERAQDILCQIHEKYYVCSIRLEENPSLVCANLCTEKSSDIKIKVVQQLIEEKLTKTQQDLNQPLAQQMKLEFKKLVTFTCNIKEQLHSTFSKLHSRIQAYEKLLSNNFQKQFDSLNESMAKANEILQLTTKIGGEKLEDLVMKLSDEEIISRSYLLELGKYLYQHLEKSENVWKWKSDPNSDKKDFYLRKMACLTNIIQSPAYKQSLIKFSANIVTRVNNGNLKDKIQQLFTDSRIKSEWCNLVEKNSKFGSGEQIYSYIREHWINIQNCNNLKRNELNHYKQCIQKNEAQLETVLKYILQLSAYDEAFTVASSNSAYLLNQSGIKFDKMSLIGIRLQDVDLSGSSFREANLSQSYFRRVKIDGCDFGKSNLTQIDWDEIDTYELGKFSGQTCKIKALTFSSDNKILVSGGSDNMIRLWDLTEGQSIRNINGHAGEINMLLFNNNDSNLLSCSQDKSIKRWSVASGTLVMQYLGHKSGVLSLALSQDGSTFASGSDDQSIIIWNIENSTKRVQLQCQKAAILTLAFSCRNILASGHSANTIKLWNITTEAELLSIQAHRGAVMKLGFSKDGLTLISVGDDAVIKKWNVQNGNQIDSFGSSSYALNAAAISCDNELIAYASLPNSKNIKILTQNTGTDLCHFNKNQSPVQALSFSANGDILASGGEDSTIYLWKTKLLGSIPQNQDTKLMEALSSNQENTKTLQFDSQPSNFQEDNQILKSAIQGQAQSNIFKSVIATNRAFQHAIAQQQLQQQNMEQTSTPGPSQNQQSIQSTQMPGVSHLLKSRSHIYSAKNPANVTIPTNSTSLNNNPELVGAQFQMNPINFQAATTKNAKIRSIFKTNLNSLFL